MNELSVRIAHALMRIGESVKKDLGAALNTHAVRLTEAVALRDFDVVEKTITVLENLLILGEAGNDIAYMKAKMLYEQCAALKNLMREEKERERIEFAISDIFQGNIGRLATELNKSGKETANPATELASSNETGNGDFSNRQSSGNLSGNEREKEISIRQQNGNANSAHIDRQEKIAGYIRQSGNVPMKDIAAAFSDVSERTLRNDVHHLLKRNLIERVGPGGPRSSYRIKKSFVAGELRS